MKGIQEIKEALKAASEEELPGLMEVYAKDTRKRVYRQLLSRHKIVWISWNRSGRESKP